MKSNYIIVSFLSVVCLLGCFVEDNPVELTLVELSMDLNPNNSPLILESIYDVRFYGDYGPYYDTIFLSPSILDTTFAFYNKRNGIYKAYMEDTTFYYGKTLLKVGEVNKLNFKYNK